MESDRKTYRRSYNLDAARKKIERLKSDSGICWLMVWFRIPGPKYDRIRLGCSRCITPSDVQFEVYQNRAWATQLQAASYRGENRVFIREVFDFETGISDGSRQNP
ncbi:hypothetical protein SH661x_000399 [Planctomicrobium sp. SH661]|uniref:hypothetical protein n=1 Tax=Planctomicrobium sp. SH661 TaxID=3448124 RepID=UPI003F5B18DA